MNGGRLSLIPVRRFEALMDVRRLYLADGVWTPDEERAFQAREREVYQALMDADEAIGMAVTMLRRGPESVSLKRRMIERGIRVYEGGERAA